jgi:hypothetical protein
MFSFTHSSEKFCAVLQKKCGLVEAGLSQSVVADAAAGAVHAVLFIRQAERLPYNLVATSG